MTIINFKNKNVKDLVIGMTILLGALAVAFLLIKSKPEAKKQELLKKPPLIEVAEVKKASKSLNIRAQGQMEAAHSLRLRSELSGKVLYKNPNLKKGGYVEKGELLLTIDPSDYELMLAQKKSALERARLEYSLEKAQSQVAKREFLRRTNSQNIDAASKRLAMRIPYLEKAQSDLNTALKDVEHAEKTLAKTRMVAPINALVSSVDIEESEIVSNQTMVANLIGVEELWAELRVAVADLEYISARTTSSPGSTVLLEQLSKTGTKIIRHGQVESILPNLGTLGHMARILVSVKNPITIKDGSIAGIPLLPGAKISADIKAAPLTGTYRIPRQALFGDNKIFVVDENSFIKEKTIEIARRESDSVYIANGVREDDLLVTTKTAAIKDGAEVRVDRSARGL